MAVLARLWAERRRSHSVPEEEHEVVLVVDEEEVFAVPEDPEGVSALSDDDLPPLEFLLICTSGPRWSLSPCGAACRKYEYVPPRRSLVRKMKTTRPKTRVETAECRPCCRPSSCQLDWN